jgi:hypothetical protein
MEGLFPLSRMAAGGRVFGEEGNVPPSTSSMITEMEMLQNILFHLIIDSSVFRGGRWASCDHSVLWCSKN